MANQLIDSVLAGDPGAVSHAAAAGPSAAPQLRELSSNDDPNVRQIALNCLAEIGGDDALQAFVARLSDDDPQVQAAALNGLHRHPEMRVLDTLLQAYAREEEPEVRGELALIVGRIPGTAPAKLAERCGGEGDEEVVETCDAALARLGDSDAQQRFASSLGEADEDALEKRIELAEYIHQPWLVTHLVALLDNEEPFRWIGVDALPDRPQYLRYCDVALNLAASITGRRFTFELDEVTNYTAAQRQEVRQALQ